ncbi:imm11 family protein [Mesobacillus selenatarsenatis]|uniref:Immunity MXAN-0049 protein domain-containing protein n=1 Tax=Mesobacillus selenatarsenatis (strain DSM 18680 / JCM 14380 / FERM P-15431 / SF-1) TaxID=1321606 RepID=A0A0A8X2N6_MESS1|nr:DUF1629 domain-containing protein [Mesobacillus selenatarsenatis]GAM12371.1 hypothetical protein SAMD00020551_0504 [Mesobacillus selenatarsenatis SF-1]
MKYYKLLLDDSNQNDIVCFCKDSKGFESHHLQEGKSIKNWNEGLTFYYNPEEGSEETDYLANSLGWFLISNKLKTLLKGIDKSEIQYLPVRVVNSKDNSIIKGYSVANILNILDVLNLEHSDYSVIGLYEEKVYSIRKYAINKNAVSDYHIFKIKGYEIPLFVSEIYKDTVLKQGITGFDFLEVKTL